MDNVTASYVLKETVISNVNKVDLYSGFHDMENAQAGCNTKGYVEISRYILSVDCRQTSNL